jgi:hypothetical protein
MAAVLLVSISILPLLHAQKTSSWDAGEVDLYDPAAAMGLHRGTIIVMNVCCKGELPQRFTVESSDSWINIHPTDAAFDLGNNGMREVHPGLDARTLPPGVHEGTIRVRCESCDPGVCDYDVKVRLTVRPRGSTAPPSGAPSTGGGPTTTPPRPPVSVARCPTPAERIKPGTLPKSCSFSGSPSDKPNIRVESCTRESQDSNSDSRNAFRKMSKVIGDAMTAKTVLTSLPNAGWSDVIGAGSTWAALPDGSPLPASVPTDPVEVGALVAQLALGGLQKVIDGASNFIDRNAASCVYITGTFTLMEGTFKCFEMQECVDGVWRDLGPVNEPRKIELKPRIVESSTEQVVLQGPNATSELNRAIQRLERWAATSGIAEANRRMKIFESVGPCLVCDVNTAGGTGVASAPGAGPGRDCERLRREILRMERFLFDLRAELDELRRTLQSLPANRQRLLTECDERVRQLESDRSDASMEWRRTNTPEAKKKLDDASNALTAGMRACRDLAEQLDREEQRLRNAIRNQEQAIADYEAELADLRRRYQECLNTGR